MGLYSEIDLGSLATLGSSGLRVEEVLLRLALTLSFDWLKYGLHWETADVLLGVNLLKVDALP